MKVPVRLEAAPPEREGPLWGRLEMGCLGRGGYVRMGWYGRGGGLTLGRERMLVLGLLEVVRIFDREG
jgi:hypothetical protein